MSPDAPQNEEPPRIWKIGDSLQATSGGWLGEPPVHFSYQWWSYDTDGQGHPIADANGVTYTPVKADQGKTLRVSVTATNKDGATTAQSEDDPQDA